MNNPEISVTLIVFHFDISGKEFNKTYSNLHLYDISFEIVKIPYITCIKEYFYNNILKYCYNINGLFAGCSSLKYIPNISNWNLKKSEDLSFVFYGCSSLISLPDISKWDISNIENLNIFLFFIFLF